MITSISPISARPSLVVNGRRPQARILKTPCRASFATSFASQFANNVQPILKAGYMGFAIYFTLNWWHYRNLRIQNENPEDDKDAPSDDS
ncbi:hypothetical protein TetV_480 [Tetraselmis virus 1]|uniref:Uncharacterized protein n=1 Tax=Tetraselmis virus 1 TaxID=2060617 RepID=A0A2P0VNV3_9VIRU|nr:hypothetical protein QJ968_gp574 [Tetraselmis virus 1]AUF82562.1 hypothetical protein TetV_480 [Tetraselmis virus 1]